MAVTMWKPKPEIIGQWYANAAHSPITCMSPAGCDRVVVGADKTAQIFGLTYRDGVPVLLGKAKIEARAHVLSAVRVGETTLAAGTASRVLQTLQLDRTGTFAARNDHDVAAKPWALTQHADWVSAVAGQLVSDRVMLEENEQLPVASASHDNTVIIWDLETSNRFEREINQLSPAQPGNLLCLTWAFNGEEDIASIVVAGSSNGMLYVWQNAIETEATIAHGLPVSTSELVCVAAHPTLSVVAVGTRDGTVALVDVNTRTILHRTTAVGAVKALAWNIEGTMLVATRNMHQRRGTSHVVVGTTASKGISFAAASETQSGPASSLHFYNTHLRELHTQFKSGSAITALSWNQVYDSRALFVGTDAGEIVFMQF